MPIVTTYGVGGVFLSLSQPCRLQTSNLSKRVDVSIEHSQLYDLKQTQLEIIYQSVDKQV